MAGLDTGAYAGRIVELQITASNYTPSALVISNASGASELVISGGNLAVFTGSGSAGRRRLDEATPLLTIQAGAPPVLLRGLYFMMSEDAPALVVDSASVKVEDCVFSRNAGGALRVLGNADVTVTNTFFETNGGDAVELGGAIHVRKSSREEAWSPSLRVASSTFAGNSAANGGAISAENVTMVLDSCEFSLNTAIFAGGALWAVHSTILLGNHTVLRQNIAPSGSSAFVSGASSSWQYALPAPRGYWIANSELCTEDMSCHGQPVAVRGVVANLALGAMNDEYPFRCAAGTFGATTDTEAQTGPSCSGVCEKGTYCIAGTSVPELCTAGAYCEVGSAAPTPCPPGTYNEETGRFDQSLHCLECPAGAYCSSGQRINCTEGTYNSLRGQDKITACLLCPTHADTIGPGSQSASDCTCRNDFAMTTVDGSELCQCPIGYGQVASSGGESCVACERGSFKDTVGNVACQTCALEHATTRSEASQSADECICEVGFFMWNQSTDVDSGGKGSGEGPVCASCESTHATGFTGLSACTTAGVTLATLPIANSTYRQQAEARYIRPCPVAAACLGGSNATDAQCAPGHTGPYCAVCMPEYAWDPAQRWCAECDDKDVRGQVLIAWVVAANLFVLAANLFKCTRKAEHKLWRMVWRPADDGARKDALSNMQGDAKMAMLLEIAGRAGQKLDGDEEGDEKDEKTSRGKRRETAAEKLKRERSRKNRCKRFMRRMTRKMNRMFISLLAKSDAFLTKARILISCYQLLGQSGVVLGVPYPTFYTEMVNRVTRALNFLSIKAFVPSIDCLFAHDYRHTLVSTTALPMAAVVILLAIARANRGYTKLIKDRRGRSSKRNSSEEEIDAAEDDEGEEAQDVGAPPWPELVEATEAGAPASVRPASPEYELPVSAPPSPPPNGGEIEETAVVRAPSPSSRRRGSWIEDTTGVCASGTSPRTPSPTLGQASISPTSRRRSVMMSSMHRQSRHLKGWMLEGLNKDDKDEKAAAEEDDVSDHGGDGQDSEDQKWIERQCSTIAFVILFVTYPNCSSTIFAYLSCKVFDQPGEDGASYLAADLSLECSSVSYMGLLPYAYMMVLLYPIGVPLYYSALLYRSRFELHELRTLEMLVKNERDSIELQQRLYGAEGVAQNAQANVRRMERKIERLVDRLDPITAKLITGYELRCFWFEVFECVRKIVLIGVPILFEEGSTEQLFAAVVICFMTFGVYCALDPFEDDGDDRLSRLCQIELFFAILCTLILRTNPSSPFMAVALPLSLCAPPLLVLFTVVQQTFYDPDNPGRFTRCLQSCGGALRRNLQRVVNFLVCQRHVKERKKMKRFTKDLVFNKQNFEKSAKEALDKKYEEGVQAGIQAGIEAELARQQQAQYDKGILAGVVEERARQQQAAAVATIQKAMRRRQAAKLHGERGPARRAQGRLRWKGSSLQADIEDTTSGIKLCNTHSMPASSPATRKPAPKRPKHLPRQPSARRVESQAGAGVGLDEPPAHPPRRAVERPSCRRGSVQAAAASHVVQECKFLTGSSASVDESKGEPPSVWGVQLRKVWSRDGCAPAALPTPSPLPALREEPGGDDALGGGATPETEARARGAATPHRRPRRGPPPEPEEAPRDTDLEAAQAWVASMAAAETVGDRDEELEAAQAWVASMAAAETAGDRDDDLEAAQAWVAAMAAAETPNGREDLAAAQAWVASMAAAEATPTPEKDEDRVTYKV